MSMRVLMVCLGNICRSPMAEGAVRARAQAAGLGRRIHVDSVGTSGEHAGCAPDPRAIAMAARHGVDIAGQRARRLAATDYADFDLILCADRSVLHATRTRMPPASQCQVELMLGWAGLEGGDVPDPYYGGSDDFEHSWRLVDALALRLVERVRDGGP